jgi:hypothetical protein
MARLRQRRVGARRTGQIVGRAFAAIGVLPLCGYGGVLVARRRLLFFSGHDQRTARVIGIGADSVQGGKADPVVVTAQQQIRSVRVPAARRDNHRDHGPGRAAASVVGEEEPPGLSRQLIVERDGIGAVAVCEPALHETSSQLPGTGA